MLDDDDDDDGARAMKARARMILTNFVQNRIDTFASKGKNSICFLLLSFCLDDDIIG